MTSRETCGVTLPVIPARLPGRAREGDRRVARGLSIYRPIATDHYSPALLTEPAPAAALMPEMENLRMEYFGENLQRVGYTRSWPIEVLVTLG